MLLFKSTKNDYILKDEDNKYKIIESKINIDYDKNLDIYVINFDDELIRIIKHYVPMKVIARILYFLNQGETVEIIEYKNFEKVDFDPVKFQRFFDLYRMYDEKYPIPSYRKEIISPLINSGTKVPVMWDKQENKYVYYKNNYLYELNYKNNDFTIKTYLPQKIVLKGNLKHF